ncbi:hypothetical protein VTK26DRAFT_8343 [Humicola hyalothermophila]
MSGRGHLFLTVPAINPRESTHTLQLPSCFFPNNTGDGSQLVQRHGVEATGLQLVPRDQLDLVAPRAARRHLVRLLPREHVGELLEIWVAPNSLPHTLTGLGIVVREYFWLARDLRPFPRNGPVQRGNFDLSHRLRLVAMTFGSAKQLSRGQGAHDGGVGIAGKPGCLLYA